MNNKTIVNAVYKLPLVGIKSLECNAHWRRRRIKTEEKAKVVAAVWGKELIQFLAALAILDQNEWKKGNNSSYSSYQPTVV